MHKDQKKKLRTELKAALADSKDLVTQSQQINKKLLQLLSELTPKCIGLYVPMDNEVDVEPFFKQVSNYQLALPRWVQAGLNEGEMSFHLYTSDQDLEEIEVFSKRLKQVKFSQEIVPDLLVVPGLGFSPKGARLGRGKGFYDRFITKHKMITVGLCFKEQLKNDLPLEGHDKLLDIVITPDEVYRCKK